MESLQEKLSQSSSLKKFYISLPPVQRPGYFISLEQQQAEELFSSLDLIEKTYLIEKLSNSNKEWLLKLSPHDDIVDILQRLPDKEKKLTLELLDEHTKLEILALLAYKEDEAGGLMNPKFLRLRPDLQAGAAITYISIQAKTGLEKIYYAYVIDSSEILLGVVSLRQLLVADSQTKVKNIMKKDIIKIHTNMNQQKVYESFKGNKLIAIPVIDDEEKMKGIITFDDVIKSEQSKVTEDIQKIGGMEALDTPYLSTHWFEMIKKRAGWLVVLFIGEMLTATAMGFFENAIAKAVVLALFIPLIISSGGNSGSQATTLIIRAMAVGEVKIKDWYKILLRECSSGLVLGLILGLVGFLRIILWPLREKTYGTHFFLVALTIGFSLVGIVVWGTLVGSMLPFLLKRFGFDPASASAPLVATLVDVTGIIIYFSVASFVLNGTLL